MIYCPLVAINVYLREWFIFLSYWWKWGKISFWMIQVLWTPGVVRTRHHTVPAEPHSHRRCVYCPWTTQSRTGLCGPLRMWALAPSQADARADRGGVPSRSVIRSSWSQTEALLKNVLEEVIWSFTWVGHMNISCFIGWFSCPALTCWMGLWAWKRMRRPSNSAKMQPTDHTSMAEP